MPGPKFKKYPVGFGRPPKGTRWKKGQSGNPRGRPKGTRNLAKDLADELSEMIIVREGGRSMKISKQRALLKQLAAKGLSGNIPATRTVLMMVATLLADKEQEGEESRLAGFDDGILENFLKRQKKKKANDS